MRYVKEELFFANSGEPFTVSIRKTEEDTIEQEQATTKSILSLVLNSYQPMQGEILNFRQTNSLNKVLDTFEDEPDEDGYFVFDEQEIENSKMVLEWTLPKSTPGIRRHQQKIYDLIGEAPSKKPEADGESED